MGMALGNIPFQNRGACESNRTRDHTGHCPTQVHYQWMHFPLNADINLLDLCFIFFSCQEHLFSNMLILAENTL